MILIVQVILAAVAYQKKVKNQDVANQLTLMIVMMQKRRKNK